MASRSTKMRAGLLQGKAFHSAAPLLAVRHRVPDDRHRQDPKVSRCDRVTALGLQRRPRSNGMSLFYEHRPDCCFCVHGDAWALLTGVATRHLGAAAQRVSLRRCLPQPRWRLRLGIEPDLRRGESASRCDAPSRCWRIAVTTLRSVELCDWLHRQTHRRWASVRTADRDPSGCPAPDADIRCRRFRSPQVAANALLVAHYDLPLPAIAGSQYRLLRAAIRGGQ
jgi:hypothetical protein